jgi:hypothetical protein
VTFPLDPHTRKYDFEKRQKTSVEILPQTADTLSRTSGIGMELLIAKACA